MGRPASRNPHRSISHIQVTRITPLLHHEPVARGRVLAHELVDHAVGLELVLDEDALEATARRVHGRLAELHRAHLPEALETRDRVVLELRAELLDDPLLLRVRPGPGRTVSSTAVDAVEGRFAEVDMSAVDQLGEVTVEEGQEKSRDVMAVAVRVREDDDLVVAELADVEVRAQATAEGGDDVGDLLVGPCLRGSRLLRVEDLSP